MAVWSLKWSSKNIIEPWGVRIWPEFVSPILFAETDNVWNIWVLDDDEIVSNGWIIDPWCCCCCWIDIRLISELRRWSSVEPSNGGLVVRSVWSFNIKSLLLNVTIP